MAARTQGRNFLTSDMGLGSKPSSTTSTGLFTELNPIDGLYYIPGMTVEHYGGGGPIVQVKITLDSSPISISDDAGVAQYGGIKIYDFPEGALCVLGAVVDGSITPAATSGTILATFDGDVAIGTVTATTGATLTSTEADILQSTATTTAVAGVGVCDAVSTATALTESGARWFDGTATAKDAYLNFVIDDDASNTASVGTVSAVVYITYLMLGDN